MHLSCYFFVVPPASFYSDTFWSHTDLMCFDGDVGRLAFLLLFCLIYMKPTWGYFSSIKGCKCGSLGSDHVKLPRRRSTNPIHSATPHPPLCPPGCSLRPPCIVLRAHPDRAKPVGSRLLRSCKPNNHQSGT